MALGIPVYGYLEYEGKHQPNIDTDSLIWTVSYRIGKTFRNPYIFGFSPVKNKPNRIHALLYDYTFAPQIALLFIIGLFRELPDNHHWRIALRLGYGPVYDYGINASFLGSGPGYDLIVDESWKGYEKFHLDIMTGINSIDFYIEMLLRPYNIYANNDPEFFNRLWSSYQIVIKEFYDPKGAKSSLDYNSSIEFLYMLTLQYVSSLIRNYASDAATVKQPEYEIDYLKLFYHDLKIKYASEDFIKMDNNTKERFHDPDMFQLIQNLGKINERIDKLEINTMNADLIQTSKEKKEDKTPPKNIFISYSHKNKKYLERLRVHLKPLEDKFNIEAWCDEKLISNDDFENKIYNFIDTSSIAILLISADFFASDFIINKELPRIIQRSNLNNLQVYYLIVEPCDYKNSILGKYQTHNPPDNPLSKMNKNDREKIYGDLSSEIYVIYSSNNL